MKTINPANFPVIDLENYRSQKSLAIDMCANCIIHERRAQRPIKSIILSHSYYQMLKKWVADNYGEEIAEGEYYIDTVMIRQETIYTGKTLLIEYFKKEELN
jgi:hypothetical protein